MIYYIERTSFSVLVVLICLMPSHMFGQGDCNALLVSINDDAKRIPSSTNIDRSDQYYTQIIKTIIPGNISSATLLVNNLQNQKGTIVTLHLLDTNTCRIQEKAITTKALANSQQRISLPSGMSSGAYVIRFKNPTQAIAPLDIKLECFKAQFDCQPFNNRLNSISRPSKYLLTGHNRKTCRTDCTNNIQAVNVDALDEETGHHPRLKWYEVDVSKQVFLDISVLATKGQPTVWISTKTMNHRHKIIHQATAKKHKVEIEMLPVHNYETIYIGVGNSHIQNIEFDLCMRGYLSKKDCIDYLRRGDTLRVVSTSMGSPYTGPFLEGESISFVYEIYDWYPIRNNWIFSVIPNFGAGWDPISFDSITAEPSICGVNDTLCENGSWTWIEKGQISERLGLNSSLNSKKNHPSGWYYQIDQKKIHAQSYKNGWGRVNQSYSEKKEPIYAFYFTLKAVDTFVCSDAPQVFVEMQPVSDADWGTYVQKPCDCSPQEFSTYLRCCDKIKDVIISDAEICESEKASLTALSDGDLQFFWYDNKPGIGNLINQGASIEFVAPYLTEERKTYEYYVIGIDKFGLCRDTASIIFEVVQKPKFNLPELAEVCLGEFIEISPLIESKYLDNVTFTWQSLGQSRRSSGLTQDGISLLGHLEDSDRFVLIAENTSGCYLRREIDVVANPLYQPELEPIYYICTDAIQLELDDVSSVLFELANKGSEIWESINPAHAFPDEGSYILRATTDKGCQLEERFNTIKGGTNDTILVVMCRNSNRSDDIEIRTYFKAAECPGGDTVKIHQFHADCSPFNKDFAKFTLLNTEIVKDDVTLYPNPIEDDRIYIKDFADNVDRICIFSISTGLQMGCQNTSRLNELSFLLSSYPNGQYTVIGYQKNAIAFISYFIK